MQYALIVVQSVALAAACYGALVFLLALGV
jgi:hypothetical protein